MLAVEVDRISKPATLPSVGAQRTIITKVIFPKPNQVIRLPSPHRDSNTTTGRQTGREIKF